MKFSEHWLREWVNLTIDSKKLIEQITMLGLEVNKIESVSEHFFDVFIGKIISFKENYDFKHQFWIVKIDIGNSKLISTFCDKNSFKVNEKVAVKKNKKTLLNILKKKNIKINKIKFEGILCSFFDLGLSNSNDIIKFPDNTPIGNNVKDHLKLDDKIININVTTNRADCFGLLGIARDVAVYNRVNLSYPSIRFVSPKIQDELPIFIENFNYCPQFLSRIIKQVNTKILTPFWMQEKLRRCGLETVNIVVDITNYVLLELGQPISIFDLNKIRNGIIVRLTKVNEKIILKNKKKIFLFSDTLVVSDYEKILSLSGIADGIYSKINQSTENIVLKCAFFNKNFIFEQIKRYNLNTNISDRYQRGIDPMYQANAIERTTELLLDICGGKPGPVTKITDVKKLPKSIFINLKRKKINNLIGHFISDLNISDILTRLGFKINKIDKETWKILVPSWRFDIKIEEDIIEEIMRIYGYNSIPNINKNKKNRKFVHQNSKFILNKAKEILVERGYQEVITYSFVNQKIQELLFPNVKPIILSNSFSKDTSVMRLSLLIGLLNTILYNQNRQQRKIKIFESGLCFFPDKKSYLEIRQDLMLSGAIFGERFNENWNVKSKKVDFFDIKGDLESVFKLIGKIDSFEFKAVHNNLVLHPGESASIYFKKKLVGFIGTIHPRISQYLNLNEKIFVFEIFWKYIKQYKVEELDYISRFPIHRRDISIIVSEKISSIEIIKECKKNFKKELINIVLFDVYKGKGIKNGFKSLAIGLFLQKKNGTFKEEEISKIIKENIKILEKKFQIILREKN